MNKTTFQEEPKTEEVGRAFCLRAAALFAFPLLTLLFAAPFPSRMAQAAPLEVDYFPDSRATVEIENPLGTPFDTVMVTGPTTVNVDLGSLGDGDSDGYEEIQTEIVQMQLTGTSTNLHLPVILRLRDAAKDPFQRSLGEMEENSNVQPGRFDLLGDNAPLCVEHPSPPPNCVGTTADSFFDVYFEVEIPLLGMKLHNRDAKHMETTITHKPPGLGETYEDPVAIRLYDESGNATDWWVAATRHTPNTSIGGIAEAPDVDASPLETAESPGGSSSAGAVAIAGIAAAAVAIGAGGWYARRRWSR